MVIYSHSRLSTFEQCQLKFKLKYLDKVEPDIEQTIEAFLGNKVHETLEWLYTQISLDKEPTLDEIISSYAMNWKNSFSSEIHIVKKEHTAEFYFNNGIRFLIKYYSRHVPFKDNTIATEKHIVLTLDPEGKYKMRGFIDRLVHHPETNIFEIHDYKTGRSMKTQKELDNDRQLALYSIGIYNHFQNVSDVRLVWHFLDFDIQMNPQRTREQLETLKKEIISLIDTIEQAKEFPAHPGPLCRWCEFRSHCPSMKDAVFD
jgi:putative RecB family exonuclease